MTPFLLAANLNAAKTPAELIELCSTNSMVAKYTIEGAHGLIAVTVQVPVKDQAGRDTHGLKVPTIEHIYRFQRKDSGMTVFRPELLSKAERAKWVKLLYPTFQKTWLARFFSVSLATISSDL